jgi:hypothetical protein
MHDLAAVVLVSNDEYWLPYVLHGVSGWFDRMVIYDVGSTDKTRDIIEWFVAKEKHRTDFYVRMLPMCDPKIQGAFRNSMIAEAGTDYYWILDGDELYGSWYETTIKNFTNRLKVEKKSHPRLVYGVIQRTEVSADLKNEYSEIRTHHRLYHRSAIWKGTHPGEEPVIRQDSKTEIHQRIYCWHMHNTRRSSKEEETPGRIRRKLQKTYHPGNLCSVDILQELPQLRQPIENFPVCPALRELQDAAV